MSASDCLKLGRVTVDDRGIRKGRFLGLFGGHFEIAWEDIVSWATGAFYTVSRQTGEQQVIMRVLELHRADGAYAVDWSGSTAEFSELVKIVERRLPGKRTDSRLEKIDREFREKYMD